MDRITLRRSSPPVEVMTEAPGGEPRSRIALNRRATPIEDSMRSPAPSIRSELAERRRPRRNQDPEGGTQSVQEVVDRVSLRHEMPLRNYDVKVVLADGSTEILQGRSRDVLSAIGLVGQHAAREWAREKLDGIQTITWVVIS
jgi:hypothetical protein